MRHAKSNSPARLKVQTISPTLPGGTCAMYGSSCCMSGNFSIIAACSSNSFFVPMTISCSIFPSLRATIRTVSPRFTSMWSGVNRIPSVIVSTTVRRTAVALPAMPHAFCSFATGPSFVACRVPSWAAAGKPSASSATVAALRIAFISLLRRLDIRDHIVAALVRDAEAHPVAGLDLVEELRVADRPHHRHGRHADALYLSVFEHDRLVGLVDLAHFAVGVVVQRLSLGGHAHRGVGSTSENGRERAGCKQECG